MKSHKIAKGCLIAVIAGAVLVVGFYWALIEAFGTKKERWKLIHLWED